MKKKDKNLISIHLDVVTAAYLETLLYCSQKSSLSMVIRDLIKDGGDEHLDNSWNRTYTGDLSPEFDAFPQTKQYLIRMDEHAMACLDFLAGDFYEPLHSTGELAQCYTEVIRWLAIQEFTKLQSTLKQSLRQKNIA